jgi:hypothetical protein
MGEVHAVSIDPVINADEAKVTVHKVTGQSTVYQNYPAQSWGVGNNTVTWSFTPPSMDVFVGRDMRTIMPITITYSGTEYSSGSNLLDDGYDALRSLPDLRIITSMSISLNGINFPSTNQYDVYGDILCHYSRKYRADHPLSAPDVTQEYVDAVGGINNPLTNYASSESFEGGLKRGAYTVTSITRGASSATVVLNLIGWIFIPGLLGLDQSESLGFTQIRSLDINTTLDFSSQKLVSHATGRSTIVTSGVSAGITAQPTLIVKYITPPPELVPKGPIHYPHFKMEKFVTSLGATLTANSTSTIYSNNVQLPCVPHYVYAFVKEQETNRLISTTDCFCAINQVSIDFGGYTGVLSSATAQDLWNISKQNGLIDSYPMFLGLSRTSGFAQLGTIGSLFCGSFGKDISMGSSGLSIGSPGPFNFKMQVSFKNINQSTTMTNPTLYIVIAYDNDMVISPGGQVVFELPSFNAGGELVRVPYAQGQFGGSFSDFIHKVGNWFKDTKIISKIGKAVAPMIPPQWRQVADTVIGSLDQAGLGTGGRQIGGRQIGGQTMSKSELKRFISAL